MQVAKIKRRTRAIVNSVGVLACKPVSGFVGIMVNANYDCASHTGLLHPREHIGQVVSKLIEIQMAMGVN